MQDRTDDLVRIVVGERQARRARDARGARLRGAALLGALLARALGAREPHPPATAPCGVPIQRQEAG